MHMNTTTPSATTTESRRRKATNVTLDAALLQEAKALDIPLTRTFDAALRSAVQAERAGRWAEENADAIAAYNERIVRDGMWSDGLRLF